MQQCHDNLISNPFSDSSAPATPTMLLFSMVPTLRLLHQQKFNKDARNVYVANIISGDLVNKTKFLFSLSSHSRRLLPQIPTWLAHSHHSGICSNVLEKVFPGYPIYNRRLLPPCQLPFSAPNVFHQDLKFYQSFVCLLIVSLRMKASRRPGLLASVTAVSLILEHCLNHQSIIICLLKK